MFRYLLELDYPPDGTAATRKPLSSNEHSGWSVPRNAARQCLPPNDQWPPRITREKAGIIVPPGEHRATFQFNSEAWVNAREFEFLVESHSGRPQESSTVRPEWFALNAIPYERMPADDALWYPPFLAGKRMRGHFDFAPDGKTLLRHQVEEIEADDLC